MRAQILEKGEFESDGEVALLAIGCVVPRKSCIGGKYPVVAMGADLGRAEDAIPFEIPHPSFTKFLRGARFYGIAQLKAWAIHPRRDILEKSGKDG